MTSDRANSAEQSFAAPGAATVKLSVGWSVLCTADERYGHGGSVSTRTISCWIVSEAMGTSTSSIVTPQWGKKSAAMAVICCIAALLLVTTAEAGKCLLCCCQIWRAIVFFCCSIEGRTWWSANWVLISLLGNSYVWYAPASCRKCYFASGNDHLSFFGIPRCRNPNSVDQFGVCVWKFLNNMHFLWAACRISYQRWASALHHNKIFVVWQGDIFRTNRKCWRKRNLIF